jgi:hypothetical protein
MLRRGEGGCPSPAFLVFSRATLSLAAFVAAPALPGNLVAPSQGPDAKPEVFEKVDPYTRGERDALERAGYVSLGPFEWAEGIRTDDIRETLGGLDVLWVETAHFKIGSTLESYKPPGDPREDKKLDLEFARLKPRLERFKPPKSKIDPWMRLHLFAQRLEDVYADFVARFGLAETEFPDGRKAPSATGPYLGDGPYLGMDRKFTVLLTEKTSSLGRFVKRYGEREPHEWDRFPLPGGTMFLGMSAEGVRTLGYDLDAGLHCAVVAEVTHNLLDGFRKSWSACPLWFGYGLAHVAARRVDERFTPAAGKASASDEDSWKWEPRVRGLIQNNVALPWTGMIAWEKWDDIKTQGHLVAWSRVSWLLSRKPAEMKTVLMGITETLQDVAETDRAKVSKEHQAVAVKAAFGKGFEELDAEWKKFVQRSYTKK